MQSLTDVYTFATQRRPYGLIVDTNVLVLLLVGLYDTALIEKCGLTRGKYSMADFDLLTKIIRPFKKIIVTPQVIAEISNLARSSRSRLSDPEIRGYLKTVVTFFTKGQTEEMHLKMSDWNWKKNLEAICAYGFVDMGMYEISELYRIPILTDETELYYFSYKKIPIMKFEHIRANPM